MFANVMDYFREKILQRFILILFHLKRTKKMSNVTDTRKRANFPLLFYKIFIKKIIRGLYKYLEPIIEWSIYLELFRVRERDTRHRSYRSRQRGVALYRPSR